MGLGIRNKTVLSWLERWRYDCPTHPFLVAGCSPSENETAAGGLAPSWDEALVLGQAVVNSFNAFAAQRADKSRKLKTFIYLALTEPRAREFEQRYGPATSLH